MLFWIGSIIEQKEYEVYYYGTLTAPHKSHNVMVLLENEDGQVKPRYVYFSNLDFFEVEKFTTIR